MPRGQRVIVHRVGQQHLGLPSLVEWDRAAHVERMALQMRRIQACEGNVARLLAHAGGLQRRVQGHTGPRRGADGVRRPGRLPWDVLDGHQFGAAVARALQRRRHCFGREVATQRVEREGDLCPHVARDSQAVVGGIDGGDGPVIAGVEKTMGRYEVAAQQGEGRAGVERLVLVDGQGGVSIADGHSGHGAILLGGRGQCPALGVWRPTTTRGAGIKHSGQGACQRSRVTRPGPSRRPGGGPRRRDRRTGARSARGRDGSCHGRWRVSWRGSAAPPGSPIARRRRPRRRRSR